MDTGWHAFVCGCVHTEHDNDLICRADDPVLSLNVYTKSDNVLMDWLSWCDNSDVKQLVQLCSDFSEKLEVSHDKTLICVLP